MLGTQSKRSIFLRIGHNFFHFLQTCGRYHKVQLPACGLFRMIGTAGQPESIHSHSGDRSVSNFKFHSGVDGATLIFRNRKDGAGDQFFQFLLWNLDGPSIVDIRQLRIFLGRLCRNGEGCVTRPDRNLKSLVHHNGDRTLRQTADDISEQFSRQNALAGVRYLSFNFIGNCGFHIITCQA